jgi:hypothetical protein
MPDVKPVPVIVTLIAVPGLIVFGVIELMITDPQVPRVWTVLAVGSM